MPVHASYPYYSMKLTFCKLTFRFRTLICVTFSFKICRNSFGCWVICKCYIHTKQFASHYWLCIEWYTVVFVYISCKLTFMFCTLICVTFSFKICRKFLIVGLFANIYTQTVCFSLLVMYRVIILLFLYIYLFCGSIKLYLWGVRTLNTEEDY